MIILNVFFGNTKGLTDEPVPIAAAQQTTIAELKSKIHESLKIPENKQIWIIRCVVCYDDQTVESCVGLDVNEIVSFVCAVQHTSELSICAQIPKVLKDAISEYYNGAIISEARFSQYTTSSLSSPSAAAFVSPNPSPLLDQGWECPTCTCINRPVRPGCEVCLTSRPADYIIPPEDELTSEDYAFLVQQRLQLYQYHQHCQEEKEEVAKQAVVLGHQIVEAEKHTGCYVNLVAIEKCPICLHPVCPGEGVILRNCTHELCRECLRNKVKESRDVFALCPIQMNDAMFCHQRVEHCEIRAILSEEEFHQYCQHEREASLKKLENIFHCLTPNCPNVIQYDFPDVQFQCDMCCMMNCIACAVQHHPLTCAQYEKEQQRRALQQY